jgi:hypothetical protein
VIVLALIEIVLISLVDKTCTGLVLYLSLFCTVKFTDPGTSVSEGTREVGSGSSALVFLCVV